MLLMVGLAVAIAAGAVFVYVGWERLGVAGLGPAALRTVGLVALAVLLFNPARDQARRDWPVTVLLDASLSMGTAGGHWSAALDTARELAGANGIVLRFGEAVAPFDSVPPADGTSRLRAALEVARGQGGPVAIVTDGELDDWATIPPTLLLGARVIVMPRDTVPNAALLDASAPRFVSTNDSVSVTITIGTWGGLGRASGQLVISESGRRIAAQTVDLPPGTGTLRRTVTIPAGRLAEGERVLDIAFTAPGDREPGDDARRRPITVTEQPGVVVLIDPPDWEGRFLVRTLADVGRTSVMGFARVSADTWIETERQTPVPAAQVRVAARGAAALILHGGEGMVAVRGRRPVWRWPASAGWEAGDWYVTPPPASPLAGRLGTIAWDALPPLTGVVSGNVPSGSWTALTARQGRRGLARPVLIGVDSAGVRTLTTGATGLWRWSLRGGAALDAYRTFIASGLDWLLASAGGTARAVLVASDAVPRGVPITFRWQGGTPPPDSVPVTLSSSDTTVTMELRFDARGTALVSLPPGSYRWRAPGRDAAGLSVVESYSDEFRPRAVTAVPAPEISLVETVTRHARHRWWLFALVVAAFAGEWAWRQRRGLP